MNKQKNIKIKIESSNSKYELLDNLNIFLNILNKNQKYYFFTISFLKANIKILKDNNKSNSDLNNIKITIKKISSLYENEKRNYEHIKIMKFLYWNIMIWIIFLFIHVFSFIAWISFFIWFLSIIPVLYIFIRSIIDKFILLIYLTLIYLILYVFFFWTIINRSMYI